ncbi:unnamed protein product [Anisakis simplex]|uniref:Alkylglycerone-phosphate synthase n=1 Tax=Anisakis simplex TaxID=6269 RepID=A0A0M3J6N6_ANISI|nr:unnamed protein product [Anisakis simplex]
MGQALKVDEKSIWKSISSMIAKLYLTKWKNFNVISFHFTSIHIEKQLTAIAEKYYGIPGGEENGKYGYRLTFAIAYLRDLAMEYGVIGESFETSVSWDKVKDLCANVKEVIRRVAKLNGVESPIASCRVTQVYDVGACVYFYLAFLYRGLENPLEVYDKIEVAARDEIIACGGSISHHHGVGKIRKQWFPQTVGTVGVSVLRALKNELDPKVSGCSCDMLFIPFNFIPQTMNLLF